MLFVFIYGYLFPHDFHSRWSSRHLTVTWLMPRVNSITYLPLVLNVTIKMSTRTPLSTTPQLYSGGPLFIGRGSRSTRKCLRYPMLFYLYKYTLPRAQIENTKLNVLPT